MEFSQPKNTKNYPALTLDNKTAKTNADKAELFAESVERHFGIECNNSDDTNLREINQFVEANLTVSMTKTITTHLLWLTQRNSSTLSNLVLEKVKLQDMTPSHTNYLG